MSTAKVKQAPARTAAKARTAPAAPAKAAASVPEPVAATPVAATPVAAEAVAAEAVPADLAQVADTAMLAATAAAEQSARQVEQAIAAGSDTIEQMVKVSQDETAKTFEKVGEMTKGQAAAAQSEALKSYHKSVQSTKETVDAALKSGTTLAHGLQEIGKTMLGLTQASIEDGVSASKKIMAAKSLHEVVELQAEFGKANMDRMMAESTRLADMTAELYRDAFAPLTAQVNAAMGKLGKTRG